MRRTKVAFVCAAFTTLGSATQTGCDKLIGDYQIADAASDGPAGAGNGASGSSGAITEAGSGSRNSAGSASGVGSGGGSGSGASSGGASGSGSGSASSSGSISGCDLTDPASCGGANRGCVANSVGTTSCTTVGSGQQGDSCRTDAQCAPGYVCDPVSFCRKWCRADDCPAGLPCAACPQSGEQCATVGALYNGINYGECH